MTQYDDSSIGTQVKLPLSVAFEVVMQGIRIRLGRSLITMMGIVLGIAFLVAILTGEVIKKGVAEEEGLRTNVNRMVNLLSAEVGPAAGRTFGILVGGQLSEAEIRFVHRLHTDGAAGITFACARPEITVPPSIAKIATRRPLESVAEGAHALLVMGGLPGDVNWSALIRPARNRVVGFTGETERPALPEGIGAVALSRRLREEEIRKAEQMKRRSAFRRNWIVTISLVASVISITNAMLMSVTERFREIGTMKCLGALSAFIRQMFLIESSLMGIAGSLLGCIAGVVFSLLAYSLTYGSGLVIGSLAVGQLILYILLCLCVGVVLSVVAAFYPARFASRMVPAHALRTNV